MSIEQNAVTSLLLREKFILIVAIVAALVGLETRSTLAQGIDFEFVTISGSIISLPEDDSKEGEWTIEDDNGEVYSVSVTETTGHIGAEPEIGQSVTIHGFAKADGTINATFIDLISQIEFDYNQPDYDGGWIHIWGTVESKPETENGRGIWTVKDQREQVYRVVVSRDTEFDDEIPEIGQTLFVKGFSRPDGNIGADEIELWEATEPEEPESNSWDLFEYSGLVVDIDDTDWEIRTPQGVVTVATDDDTSFFPERPSIGQRITAWGFVKDDENLALEIARDLFSAGEIVVRLETNVISQTIASRYDLIAESTRLSSGGIYQFASANLRGQVVQAIVADMQADDDIIWAEVNHISELPVEGAPYKTWGWGSADDAEYTNQAAYAQINLDAAHTKAQGDNVVVAVLDTGVDLNHPSLQGHLVSGWDMVDDDAKPQDEGSGIALGHGTHVSGIVAKVAPNSKIMPVRVLDSNGRGDSFIVAYAVDWAVRQGANIINLSLGMTEYSWVLHEAVQDAVSEGVVVVGAAGNSSTNQRHYPAAFADVIGVTAVDANNTLASFANYGNWVSIAAPGVGIRSTIVSSQGSGFATWSGTSMATPFVSGTAALVRQTQTDASSRNISRILVNSGSEVNGSDGASAASLAWPLLNAGNAVGADPVEPGQNDTGNEPNDPTDNGIDSERFTFGIFIPFVQN